MSVHVDEVHTDVIPAVGPGAPDSSRDAQQHLGAADDSWEDSRRRAMMMARRTAAEGFDD